MDNYCLSKSEIHKLIECRINNKDISDDDFSKIIDRALINWDINLISCNTLFSIILEQYIKIGSINGSIIDSYYNLTDEMYISIEEFNTEFVDYIYNNKMPVKRNSIIEKLVEARKNNNNELVDLLETERNVSFEEDLIILLEDYHGKIYR